jgi:putative ABC transport system permease protein
MLHAAWRSLLGRKVRLVMSTFAIVLGVAFVVGTLIFTDTLNKSFVAIFDNSVGDVVVQPSRIDSNADIATTVQLPGSLVGKIAALDGVRRADGKVVAAGVFVVGTNGKVIGGQGPPGFAFNDNDAPAAHGIKPLQVVNGRHPRGPNEVAMDIKTAERAGYHLGDKVRIVSATKRALLTPTLVGLADFPDGGSLNGATATIWDTKTAQKLFLEGRDGYNTIWVTADDGVSQQDLRDRVAKVLPADTKAVAGDKAAEQAASQLLKAIRFITIFLLVFAGIALVVGSFLIINTFSILVAQRSRELALLRALGASRRQVSRSVLFEAFVVGLVGSTLGVGLGVLLAIAIRFVFGQFGLDLSGTSFVFAPRTFLAAYGIGLVVTMVAAYLPARRSSRIAPVAALRDDVAMPESSMRVRFGVGMLMCLGAAALMVTGLTLDVPKKGYWVGGGILAALLGVAVASPVLSKPFLLVAAAVYRAAFGSVGRLAGQNSLRNPRRTAATASALMIGMALVTTMSIAGASAKASVDDSISQNFVGDLVISNLIGQGFSPSVSDRAEKVSGVESVVRTRYAQARVDGERKFLGGVDPAHLGDAIRLKTKGGGVSALGDNGGCLMNEDFAKEHTHKRGDLVTWQMPQGDQELRVVGTYDPNGAVFATCVVNLDTFAAAGFQAQDNVAFVTVKPGVQAATVENAINQQIAKLPTVTVKNQQEYAAEQRAPIDRLVLMIYALLGMAIVIALLGVVNTLALSVIERTREIGLLRAIGLSRAQLRRMIGLESIVIAVLGALLGVAMGLIFGIALMASLRDEGLTVTRIPGMLLTGFVVSAAVVGVVTAVLPARRAARLDVLTAIATE